MRRPQSWLAVLSWFISGSVAFAQGPNVGKPPATDWPMYRRDPSLTLLSVEPESGRLAVERLGLTRAGRGGIPDDDARFPPDQPVARYR